MDAADARAAMRLMECHANAMHAVCRFFDGLHLIHLMRTWPHGAQAASMVLDALIDAGCRNVWRADMEDKP